MSTRRWANILCSERKENPPFYGFRYVTDLLKDEEVDAADPDKRGNMKLMDQGREADNEFEEGKSVSPIS